MLETLKNDFKEYRESDYYEEENDNGANDHYENAITSFWMRNCL